MKRPRDEEPCRFTYTFMPMQVRGKRRKKDTEPNKGDDYDFMKQYMNVKFNTLKKDTLPDPILQYHRPIEPVSKPPGTTQNASKYPNGTSPIESLPHDILHDIFSLADWNVALPRSSHVIGAKLSSQQTYTAFCREMLCYRVIPSPDLLLALLPARMPDDGFHTYPSIALRSPDIKPDYIRAQVAAALDSRWLSHSFLTALRTQIQLGANPTLGRILLMRPSTCCLKPPTRKRERHEEGWSRFPTLNPPVVLPPVPVDAVRVTDICLQHQHVPEKLLTLPRKEAHTQTMRLLYGLGARIATSPLERLGVLGDECWRRAVIAGDYQMLWALLAPGSGVRPYCNVRDEMLLMTGCARDVIRFLSSLKAEYARAKVEGREKRGCFPEGREWLGDGPEVATKLRWRYGRGWREVLGEDLRCDRDYTDYDPKTWDC